MSSTSPSFQINAPLVSIIMNCYNSAATLAQSIESVVAQSYTHWEIIFFDSASDDASWDIAQNAAKQDARITCYSHAQRIPLGDARNRALHHAQGEYIAFLDCDDIWHAEKLFLQVTHMQEHPHIDILCTDTENFCDTRTLGSFFAAASPEKGVTFVSLIQKQWMALSSVMLRHSALTYLAQEEQISPTHEEILPYFDSRFMLCSDADLLYRLTYLAEQKKPPKQCKQIRGQSDYLPQVLTRRRLHTHNITHTHGALWHEEIQNILEKFRNKHAHFDTQYPEITYILERRALFHEALHLWRIGQGQKARRLLRQNRNSFSFKFGLFYLFSFLPPSAYAWGAQVYMSLPALFKR